MRISFKVMIWFWVGLLLIIGGLFFGAYSKLQPETFVAVLNKEAQRSYPGSQLSVGKVDYRFSVDFNLNLKDLVLSRSGNVLGKIGEVELKVPWWLLLFNRGNAQINLSELTIYLDNQEFETSSKVAAASDKAKTLKITLPDYLSDAHYTIRAKNVNIQDIRSRRRYFTLSKLLVREFQYGKNSAFEMNIPISIRHKKTNYNSELWLFGDVTPRREHWDLNYRGEFKTKEASDKFQIEDLVIDGKASFNPSYVDIQASLNLLVERAKVGSGEARVKSNELNVQINFDKIPLSYLSLIGEEIKNPFLGKNGGTTQGSVKFSKLFDQEGSAHLNGKLSFDGDFKLNPTIKFPGKWQIAFDDSKWETSFLSPKSEVSFFRRAVIDFDKSILTQYAQEMGFNGIECKSSFLPVDSIKEFLSTQEHPYFSTLISIKKCVDGKRVMDGSFRYGITPDQKFYQASLLSEGSLQLDYQKKADLHQLDLAFVKFPWFSSYQFLTPYFQADGILDGKVSGRWDSSWSDGQWILQAKASEYKGAKSVWQDLNDYLLTVFELDPQTSSHMNWNATVNKGNIKLTSLALNTEDPAIITGLLFSDIKKKSFLTLSHPKNKKWKPVKKEIKEVFWKKDI